MEYLFDVINMFDMNDAEKKQFLQEILQYWILSVKDYKWHEEKERRYVLFCMMIMTIRKLNLMILF